MMILLAFSFLVLFIAGVAAGILSSLFGLGGGLVTVPILYLFFYFNGVDHAVQMHMAVGTSLVIMIMTTATSIIARVSRGHLIWPLVRWMFPWVAVSALCGALMSHYLSSLTLKYIFIFFLILIIAQAFFKKGFTQKFELKDFNPPPRVISAAVAIFTGFISVLMGMGGSVFTLPLFRFYKLPMEYAAGTAVALTPAVAITGAVTYLLTGLSVGHLPAYSLGYLNLPAFVGVSLGSLCGVPLGLRISSKLNDGLKAKIYRGFLIIILFSMLI
jgi:uncharacterized membrane protein YfcA